ncbi:hypothetical protein PG990_006924 [Apiospora arundinis]
MFDDTAMPDAANPAAERPHGLAVCLKSNITGIMSHATVRGQADRWSRNLCFLTFDDDDGKSSAYAEDVPSSSWVRQGQCQPCEDRQPAPNGHICPDHMAPGSNTGADLLMPNHSCTHVQARTCEDCIAFPLFPKHGKVTRFRIRRLYRPNFKGIRSCNHFFAASYCWNSRGAKGYATGEDEEAKRGPYQVVEENGSRRDMRANPHTIDRLVNFARENGFRMIWIDQECIDQNNDAEKEVAIQAMDLVYFRAGICVGLMEAELEQQHLNCFLWAFEKDQSALALFNKRRGGGGAFLECRSQSPELLAETVSRVVNDKWNTRAWVLQEAFASSGRMVLLFPRAQSVSADGWLLVCHELSRSELAIDLDVFQMCLRIITPVAYETMNRVLNDLRKKEGQDLAVNNTRDGLPEQYRPLVEQTAEEIRLTMARLRTFHPERPDDGPQSWPNQDLPRRFCNAAMSLTYLRLRGLLRACDKLAIVANLGGYAVRLNTYALDKTQTSLSLCVLVLALANGDFSLLIPEFYSASLRQPLTYPQGEDPEFSWVHSGVRELEHIQSMTAWKPDSRASIQNICALVDISGKGLSIPGFLWQVDDFIKLESLQVKYADPWRRLTALIKSGSNTRTTASRDSIMKATTHILFELIQFLTSTGHHDAANAIWNSTANWTWRPKRGSNEKMPERVDQFPQGLQVEDRGGMFLLDPSPDGRYFQCWIIDRIMLQGGICVARAISQRWADEPMTPPSNAQYASMTDDERKTYQKNLEWHEVISKIDVMKNHSHYMATARSVLELSKHQFKVDNFETDVSVDSYRNLRLRSLGTFYMLSQVSRMGLDSNAGRFAIFDVDMPQDGQETWVMAPFQLELESIPIPETRACSVCWIVEPVSLASERPGEEPAAQATFRTRQMVRGMWQYARIPFGCWNLV